MKNAPDAEALGAFFSGAGHSGLTTEPNAAESEHAEGRCDQLMNLRLKMEQVVQCRCRGDILHSGTQELNFKLRHGYDLFQRMTSNAVGNRAVATTSRAGGAASGIDRRLGTPQLPKIIWRFVR